MWLEKIDIQHFRNYTEASVSFSPHLNIFLGRNAQGKTNILEAIYFLALTRSHRTRSISTKHSQTERHRASS